jgi:hypothetical protein
MIVRLGIESGLQLQSAKEGPGQKRKTPGKGSRGPKTPCLLKAPLREV